MRSGPEIRSRTRFVRRKGLVLAVVAALFAGESLYFFGQCRAGFERLLGERAFYRNNLAAAWRYYQQALDHGGPPGLLERDLLEVLLFGLDQREVGVRTDLPLNDDAAMSAVRRLTAQAISRAPYHAAHWSVASDGFLRAGRLNRRRLPLDLSAVSEEPLENFTREDWWGIAALEKAASLEASNYLYDDLLAEHLLAYGADEEAARASRRAVAAYPRLDGHTYLMRSDLPASVLEAAVRGFEEALRRRSLIARAAIEIDAGRLLVRHNREELAIPFLERAAHAAPDLYDARMELAMALFRVKRFKDAIPHIVKASERLPDYPFPHYYLGLARMEVGEREAAIEHLRTARILGKGEPMFLHAFGAALEAAGQLREAERQFTAAAYQNPEDASAWSVLLAFHLRHGDRAAASRDCEKLLALAAGDDRVREQCAAVGRGGA